jgi:hypothetical protein
MGKKIGKRRFGVGKRDLEDREEAMNVLIKYYCRESRLRKHIVKVCLPSSWFLLFKVGWGN